MQTIPQRTPTPSRVLTACVVSPELYTQVFVSFTCQAKPEWEQRYWQSLQIPTGSWHAVVRMGPAMSHLCGVYLTWREGPTRSTWKCVQSHRCLQLALCPPDKGGPCWSESQDPVCHKGPSVSEMPWVPEKERPSGIATLPLVPCILQKENPKSLHSHACL